MHTQGTRACLLRLTSCPPRLGTKMLSLGEEPLLMTRKGQRWGSDLGKQEIGASEKSFKEEQRWNRGNIDQASTGSYKDEAVMVEAAQ